MTGWLVISGSDRRHVRSVGDLWEATKGGAAVVVVPFGLIRNDKERRA